MEKINILVVEDDADQQGLFKDATGRFESNNPTYEISKVIENNVNIGVFKTLLSGVDFLIVDLRIPNEGDGNSIIKTIRGANLVPVFVVTAHPGDLEDGDQTPFYRIYDRGSGEGNIYDDVLADIKKLYDTGFSKVVGKHGTTNEVLNNLVWGKGLSNINEWAKFKDVEKAEKSLSRYILSHLHHSLSGDYDDFHPEEIYLKTSSVNPVTGTILKKDGAFYLVLTPACDIATGTLEGYSICAIEQLGNCADVIRARDAYEADPIDSKMTTLKNCLKTFKKTSADYAKFLPKSTLFSGGYVNFRKLEKVEVSSIADYESICLISAHFLKDIVASFGYYYSRQGQPNIDSLVLSSYLSPSPAPTAV